MAHWQQIENQEGVIYARYSSHAQRDVSIEQQIRACRTFAERQGIHIVHVYEDRAVTGTSDKRPGFQKMVADAKKHTWSYVIVYTLDRFARDRYDSAVYKRQLKDSGVKVLSAMENISDDPTGVLMESLLEGLAEYYSKELSRKIQRGMMDNASKCMVNGSLPLGYVRGEDGRYAIDEAEAEVVREIFRRVKDGERFAIIFDDLNRRGIRTKKGKQWNHSSFNRLLTNERYIGVYYYSGIRIPGGVPPILSQSLFDAVQARLHKKRNPRKDPTGLAPQRRRREGGVYLLTGKLFCGHCKSAMVGISGKSQAAEPYYYYTCKGKRSGGGCDKHNVRRDQIELTVATALRDTMLTDEAIEALASAAVAYHDQQIVNSEAESLRRQLEDVNRSIANLVSAIEAGIFSAATQSRLTELELQQRDLSALLSLAQADEEEAICKDDIISALQMYQDGDVADKGFQEALIDAFLIAAYVYDDHIKYVVNLGGKNADISLPLDFDPDASPSDICISAPSLHHKGIKQTLFLQRWLCCNGLAIIPSQKKTVFQSRKAAFFR